MPREYVGQVILIHNVLLARPSLLLVGTRVLLLVLGEDEVGAPVVLPAGVLGEAAVGAPVDGLGHAVDVAAVVPLVVFLEVHLEVALGVGGAAGAGEGGLAARRAELLGHVLADLEAAVAAEDPVLEVGDAGERGGEEVEVHAEGDVLHGVVGGQDGGLEDLVEGLGGDGGAGVVGLVFLEVGGGDPAVLVVRVGGFFDDGGDDGLVGFFAGLDYGLGGFLCCA